jgi:uncharacterized membrane protein YjgN (DUF898 family)
MDRLYVFLITVVIILILAAAISGIYFAATKNKLDRYGNPVNNKTETAFIFVTITLLGLLLYFIYASMYPVCPKLTPEECIISKHEMDGIARATSNISSYENKYKMLPNMMLKDQCTGDNCLSKSGMWTSQNSPPKIEGYNPEYPFINNPGKRFSPGIPLNQMKN